ncbi:MAG TPA: tryptophan synthase subunit alpha [Solirubrobacteraceae bacterium]|jgi:tryptophan synthase alpha chain|nr:tryptophan synthase subunit alpha [Solirubrobacteraceae bacterium]
MSGGADGRGEGASALARSGGRVGGREVPATGDLAGVERIAAAFAAARAHRPNRETLATLASPIRPAALMPYLMGGFPSLAESLRVGEACVDAGADILELGVPYSDPLADGPVIHEAATRALAAGANLGGVLEVARALAGRIPVVLMCYANMVLAPGVEAFVERLARTGACGLIVPDLPYEEAGAALAACDAHGVAFVPLVAPTTPPERLREIGARARGFLYTVSVVGTTGERAALSERFAEVVARAKAATTVPVALGFGIGTPAQAREAAHAGADGVIVGSRLVRAAGESDDPAAAVGALVAELAAGLRG